MTHLLSTETSQNANKSLVEHQEFIDTIFQGSEEFVAISKGFYETYSYDDIAHKMNPEPADYYYCISSLSGETTEKGYLARGRDQCRYVYCLPVDDVGEKTSSDPTVTPTYKLFSSAGSQQWGYRLHAYDVSTPEGYHHFEACLKAVAKAGWSDEGARGCYRIMRVPGSINIKEGRGNYISHVVEWNPDRVWHLDELMEELGLKPFKDNTTPQSFKGTDLSLDDCNDEIYHWLLESDLIMGEMDAKGFIPVSCPWECEHSRGGAKFAGYSPELGEQQRGFSCFHSHEVSLKDFLKWVAEQGGPDRIGFRDLEDPEWDLDSDTKITSKEEMYRQMQGLVSGNEDAIEPTGRFIYRFQGGGLDEDTFDPMIEIEQMPFIIDGLLPQTSFGIAGAGGTMKSTTMLRIMMHTVLGIPFAGREILKPGPCVFITGEDDLNTIRYRVRKMAFAMGLDFEPEKLKQLAEGLIIEDTNGAIARLVESANNNLYYTSLVKDFEKVFKDIQPSIVCFDPMVYFGPGENFVNDGPAMMMALARKFSDDLGCATGFLHHTGKQVAREGIIDQYAGRGGSSFADNARMVGVMAPASGDYSMPEGWTPETLEDAEQVSCLHIPKLSHGKVPPQPLWIKRCKSNPWRFEDEWGQDTDSEATAEAFQLQQKEKTRGYLQKLYDYVQVQTVKGSYPTARSIRDSGMAGLSRARLITLCQIAQDSGALKEKPLPPSEVKGAKKTYLDVDKQPNDWIITGVV